MIDAQHQRKISATIVIVVLAALLACGRKEVNQFTFCRDFNPEGCIGPMNGTAVYSLEKSDRSRTVRDFYNSVYFRGDRLAFAIRNADSRRAVDFECLHGDYFFPEQPQQRYDLEYIELRDPHVYGLVMVGSLIEKKYTARKSETYKPLPPFAVTYRVFCGKHPLIQETITVGLK